MKNKTRLNIQDCWRILTEVPGWPGAPRLMRVKRLLPVVIPVTGIAFVFIWTQLWTQPRIRATRAAHQPFLALEQEVSDLQLSGSDDRARDAATRAAQITDALLAEPSQAANILEKFTRAAQPLGWEAVFHPLPVPTAAPPADAMMIYVTARGKLPPLPGNAQPFTTLMALLEQFSLPNQSIDLTRLSVRADENGKQSAEVNLRIGCRITHEKTAQ